jgi:hypothetical protein
MYHKSTVNLWESQLYNVSEALRGQYALMTMMEEMLDLYANGLLLYGSLPSPKHKKALDLGRCFKSFTLI